MLIQRKFLDIILTVQDKCEFPYIDRTRKSKKKNHTHLLCGTRSIHNHYGGKTTGEKGYNIAGFSAEKLPWEKTAMQQRHNGFLHIDLSECFGVSKFRPTMQF